MAISKWKSWIKKVLMLSVPAMVLILTIELLSSMSEVHYRLSTRRHRKYVRVRSDIVDDDFDRLDTDGRYGPQLPRANQTILKPVEKQVTDLDSKSTELPDDNVTDAYDQTNQSDFTSLLTLFTTMKDTENRSTIHANTLDNWAALRPYVIPVLFIENNTRDKWRTLATDLGWDIRNVTRTNNGIPTLKDMFLQVQREYKTPFYGYANADIVFDATLISNMKTFLKYHNYTNNIFIIGKRNNLNVSQAEVKNATVFNPDTVAELSGKYGKLFESYAQDYFITSRRGFPWHKVLDVVVGRAGYDNYLVVKAQEWSLTVVDASYTLNAVHQTGIDGNRSGWGVQDHRCLNRELIRKHANNFDYSSGQTKCAKYITYKDITGAIRILQRPAKPRDCSQKRIHNQPTLGCV